MIAAQIAWIYYHEYSHGMGKSAAKCWCLMIAAQKYSLRASEPAAVSQLRSSPFNADI